MKLNERAEPTGVERMGVHLFEAGTEGLIEKGMDASRAAKRRAARQARKQYRCRCLRKRRLLRWLQELGLMPPGDVSSGQARNELLGRVDAELRAKWEPPGTDHRLRQLLPYRLRAAGLKEKLEPYELGRALYHLAQRRGYQSNRKQVADETDVDAGSSPDEAEHKKQKKTKKPRPGSVGEVQAGIDDLRRRMSGAGCTTLAGYFATLDPTGKLHERIRAQWTPRELYRLEFERLWEEQAKHHPSLNSTAAPRPSHRIKHPPGRGQPSRSAGSPVPPPCPLSKQRTYREEVGRALFFQRPLRSAAGLVGRCSLTNSRCAPKAHPLFQRFRILQQVNNLRVQLPGGAERDLTQEERSRLTEALGTRREVAFSTLKTKKWFGKGASFNLERGKQKKLVGNITEARCRAVFGADRWAAVSETDRAAVVHDLIVWVKPAALARRGQSKWGLSPQQAVRFGNCVLEQGYAAHSVQAYGRLVKRMEIGAPYMTAVVDEFQKRDVGVHELLPAVLHRDSVGDPRNPTVLRALTELRKLVNAIVRRYGKPEWIRLELARDLKRSRKARERMSEEMRARESAKNKARAEILRRAGIAGKDGDVEKYLLAEECGFVCPYTGKQMDKDRLTDILGNPEFEVEHIWPRSKCLDNGFLNKTLCHVNANRTKRNLIPHEAYGEERLREIVARVAHWPDSAGKRIKLSRFLATQIPPEHRPEAHLAETRKVSALTAEYLGRLYGGVHGTDGRQRIWVTTGILTSQVREMWRLNALLSKRDVKDRDDHRHHAIDALVVALTDGDTIGQLQQATAEAERLRRRGLPEQDPPWDSFFEQASERVAAINVSFRQTRRVRGALHDETLYAHPRPGESHPRVRKELSKLTEKDAARIIDPRARAAVAGAIRAQGFKPKGTAKAYTEFAERDTHPPLGAGWVHKVRVRSGKKGKLRPIGPGCARDVMLGANHHIVIRDAGPAVGTGAGEWKESATTLMEAHRRAGAGEAVVHRADKGSERFLFSLAPGEFILMDTPEDPSKRALYRITNISEGQSEARLHTDGRPVTALRADKKSGKKDERLRIHGEKLQRLNAQKVNVTYLGEIQNAGG
ncbi:MAG TPA: HNH endonuclease domain-containing protein [Phycisphaerales bacterium]|nr:HNH endonuclease domain-containing protein [Phycisphaerales bacterium]